VGIGTTGGVEEKGEYKDMGEGGTFLGGQERGNSFELVKKYQ